MRLADSHLKGGGDAVQRLQTLTLELLGMLMEINKTRGHHQASSGNHTLSGERVLGNFRNLALGDSHVANRVKTGLRIKHAAALNHKIVCLRKALRKGH